MRLSAGIQLAALLAILSLPARADERIEGAVIDTRVTYCEAGKGASCKGSLTLQRELRGQRETMTIEVPLGTPISRGCQAVPLHRLGGRTVIVTEDDGSGAPVAKAIEALDSADAAC
jgi:hypothetical protein